MVTSGPVGPWIVGEAAVDLGVAFCIHADVLGVRPIRSHLVQALVQLDRDHAAAQPTDRWEDCYAAP
jgi:hypothetical protein